MAADQLQAGGSPVAMEGGPPDAELPAEPAGFEIEHQEPADEDPPRIGAPA